MCFRRRTRASVWLPERYTQAGRCFEKTIVLRQTRRRLGKLQRRCVADGGAGPPRPPLDPRPRSERVHDVHGAVQRLHQEEAPLQSLRLRELADEAARASSRARA